MLIWKAKQNWRCLLVGWQISLNLKVKQNWSIQPFRSNGTDWGTHYSSGRPTNDSGLSFHDGIWSFDPIMCATFFFFICLQVYLQGLFGPVESFANLYLFVFEVFHKKNPGKYFNAECDPSYVYSDNPSYRNDIYFFLETSILKILSSILKHFALPLTLCLCFWY